LVEDQERAGGVAERTNPLEEARFRRDDPHVPCDRLDENAGEPLAVARDRGRSGVEVVVGADDGVGGHAARDPGARRDPQRRVSGSAWPKTSGPQDSTQSRYRLPSTSSRWAPSPRLKKTGSSSPTERIARTGELTPPGISPLARRKSPLCCFRATLRVPPSSTT